MSDKTEFRIGRSHGDIIYHHVAGRDYKSDPRYVVCSSDAEARLVAQALNEHCEAWTKDYFEARGLRW